MVTANRFLIASANPEVLAVRRQLATAGWPSYIEVTSLNDIPVTDDVFGDPIRVWVTLKTVNTAVVDAVEQMIQRGELPTYIGFSVPTVTKAVQQLASILGQAGAWCAVSASRSKHAKAGEARQLVEELVEELPMRPETKAMFARLVQDDVHVATGGIRTLYRLYDTLASLRPEDLPLVVPELAPATTLWDCTRLLFTNQQDEVPERWLNAQLPPMLMVNELLALLLQLQCLARFPSQWETIAPQLGVSVKTKYPLQQKLSFLKRNGRPVLETLETLQHVTNMVLRQIEPNRGASVQADIRLIATLLAYWVAVTR